MNAARLGRDAALIYAAGVLRSATGGLGGVVLAIYLPEIGLPAAAIRAGIRSDLAVSCRARRVGRAFGGACPTLLIGVWHVKAVSAPRATFLMCAVATMLSIVPYLALTRGIEVSKPATSRPGSERLDPHTRGVVTRLALLFGLDSIGGGF